MTWLRFILMAAVLFAGGLASPRVVSAQVTGEALVLDSDTIEIDGKAYDLWGIDALERGQMCLARNKLWPCGETALALLKKMADGKTVNCTQITEAIGERPFVSCRAGKWDLAQEMVKRGYAFAYTRYTKLYMPQQSAARDAKAGMFRGEVLFPWEWRRGRRLTAP